ALRRMLRRPYRALALLGGICFALVALGLPHVGRAAGTTYNVVNSNDSGDGSLRQAILDSNAHPPSSGSRNSISLTPLAGPQNITPGTALPPINVRADFVGAASSADPFITVRGSSIGGAGV